MKLDEDDRLSRVAGKVVEDCNKLLSLTRFTGKIDRSHVTISYEATGKISAKVQCVICRQKKCISLNTNKYSACIANFKRHISGAHLQNDSSSQPKLDSFLCKPASSRELSRNKSVVEVDSDGE